MIWIYVKMAGFVSQHVVFQSLVAPVITTSKTTWGYRELQVSRKLEHRLRHYISAAYLLMRRMEYLPSLIAELY